MSHPSLQTINAPHRCESHTLAIASTVVSNLEISQYFPTSGAERAAGDGEQQNLTLERHFYPLCLSVALCLSFSLTHSIVPLSLVHKLSCLAGPPEMERGPGGREYGRDVTSKWEGLVCCVMCMW